MKALVTGAAGFIGSHLCERLLEDGWEVVGLDSFEDYYPRAYKERNIAGFRDNPRFRLLEANILDLDKGLGDTTDLRPSLEQLLSEVDYVFHQAAQAGVRASWGKSFEVYVRNNVLATQLLLEVCKGKENIKRFIYASSSSVYGDTDQLPMREDAVCRPVSPYGVTKLAAEHLCYLYWKNFQVPTVSLRYFTVYGPRQRPDMAFYKFIRAALEGKEIETYGDGQQTRDFTYVSDIIEANLLALNAPPGEVFNIGGGSRVTLTQVLEALKEILSDGVRIRQAETQKGDVRHTWACLDKARSVLEYQPRVPLKDGVAKEVQWLNGWSENAAKQ
ncbi:MAG: NAD-dependent epimerase/dehydratase family protein [Clostridia bacterium]|nr:MAG: NAD-dependent epimerase/dehydratase family protein [Clostridia bacterium]